MPQGAASMKEIAKAAGVSVSAVSLALRNSPKVSQKRRADIARLAQKMGYRSDPRLSELMAHLRTARPARAHANLAFVIPELDRARVKGFTPVLRMLEGVREMARAHGFGVDVFYLADPGMNARRLRSILVARGIRGLVVAPCASGVAELDLDLAGFSAATAGYSIQRPKMHRACPDYLQMMDELLAACTALGYRRPGLVMTYREGGLGHKLFTSAFLYDQSQRPRAQRIPILPKDKITAEHLRAWIDTHRPDVVISDARVYGLLRDIGVRVPQDAGFASIDLSQPPSDVAGADHRYEQVGREACNLVLSQLNLNQTGEPDDHKTLLVDSHQRAGFSLVARGQKAARAAGKTRGRAAKKRPAFRGFLS